MIATLGVVVVAIALAVLLLHVFGQRRMTLRGVDDIPSYTRPVHMPALLNLLDESQQQFLRERLPGDEFNALQRKRIRALIKYIDRIAGNAAVLQRVGDLARQSADPRVVSAAEELATLALQTRIYASLARLQLFASLVFVHRLWPVRVAIRKYITVVEKTERFVRFQRPQRVQAISAHL